VSPSCACVVAGHGDVGTELHTEGILGDCRMDTSAAVYHLVRPVCEMGEKKRDFRVRDQRDRERILIKEKDVSIIINPLCIIYQYSYLEYNLLC